MKPAQKKPIQNTHIHKTHTMTGSPQLRAAQSLKEAVKQALNGPFLQQHNMYLSFINPPPTGHNADGYWQHHSHISHKMPLPHVASHNSRLRQPASERQPGAKWSQ